MGMGTELNPSNSERVIKRINEYKAFIKWNSIPANFRGLESKKLLKLGIEEEFHQLLQITSLTQFAKTYKVSPDTLTDWKKRSHFDNDLKNAVDKELFQKMYSRVMYAFTMKTIESGDAARFMAWMKMFAGHVEQIEVSVNETTELNINVEDGQSIMDIVSARMAKSNRIGNTSEMEEITKDVEDVEFEELPSQQQYDFNKIEEIHKAKKKVAPKVEVDSSDIKSKLAASLAKLQKKKK